jgi:hypothetical protein
MTEADWLGCDYPRRMLRFLIGTEEPRVQNVREFPDARASDRKFRLFACACYRRIRHLLPNPLAAEAVGLAEGYADQLVTEDDLQRADGRLREALHLIEGPWRASQGPERTALLPTHDALALAYQATRREAPKAAYYASSNAYLAFAALMNPGVMSWDSGFYRSQRSEERNQVTLLRDIFGPLPFRDIRVPAQVLAWNDGCVVRLATAIYEGREFTPERMGVLADALEDAGGDNAEILNHCRLAGVHVRGCFVIDLFTGRE